MKQFNSLFHMMEAFPDEQSAVDHLRVLRWGANDENAHCPHCGGTRLYHFADRRNHKCGDCRKRFSIKVGTIFEDSKIALRKWFMAVWMITSHKKGIASTTLARDIKVTQKTAWLMLHRLRIAARTKSFNAPLKGTVETDETFIGGKEKNKHAHERSGVRGPSGKTVVWARWSGMANSARFICARSRTFSERSRRTLRRGQSFFPTSIQDIAAFPAATTIRR